MNRKISYLIERKIFTNKTKEGKELREIFEEGIRAILLIKTEHLEGYEEIINGASIREFLFGLAEYNEKLLDNGEKATFIAWLVRIVSDYVMEYLTQDESFEPAIGTPKDEMWYVIAIDKFYNLPIEESRKILKNALNKFLMQS